MGYEAFRTLVFNGEAGKKKPGSQLTADHLKVRDSVKRDLLDAADLIVCDEGHMIKSLKSLTNRAVTKIKTKRRIVLTGTPIQNNLMECNGFNCNATNILVLIIFSYSDHAMVNFVKPSFLGTADEFSYNYAKPIAKGQHKDSTQSQIKQMRLQSFNLNKELESFVHVSGFFDRFSLLYKLYF